MTSTVYVPLDGSDRARRALAPAAGFAARAGAELVLLATPWPDTSIATVDASLSAQAASWCSRLGRCSSSAELPSKPSSLRPPSPMRSCA